MEPKLGFTINAGVKLDLSKFQKDLAGIADSVKKAPPVKINAGVENVSSAEAANEILKSIQAQATAIDSIVAKQDLYKNELGATATVIKQITAQWREGTDKVFTRTLNVENEINKIGEGYKKVGRETAQLFVGKQTAGIEKQFAQRAKEFDNMAKRGQDYATRSEKWSGSERENMQKTNELLQQQIAEYNNLRNAQQWDKLPAAEKAIRATNTEMENLISKSKYGAGALRGWSDSITNAIKQTVSYTLSLGTLRAAQQMLNEGIQYSIDLNTEMTKIQVLQVEGAKTADDIENLAGAYNDLAKEMKVSTISVAEGSVEWLRQGKTIKETQDLLKASTMLSKLGNTQAAEATEYLTSTLNSYQIGAEHATEVVDKLVAVDNVAATSVKELATALQYSAASAKDAGVTLEQLISYTGVVSSTTRQNAESIGQGFKTIFARMQDIKAGKIDEDGLGINNVDIALKRVNMELRNTDGTFKDLGGVLEELSTKWDTLSETEQNNISKAIAGVRQQNLFKVLMMNMNDALDLQEEQYNATGLAADRYAIYMNSVEAAQNELKASIEGLWQDSIKSGLIKSVIDATTNIVDFIDAIGGLKAVIVALGVAIIAIQWNALSAAVSTAVLEFLTATTFVEGLTGALSALNLAFLASPWFWAIAGAAALAGGLYYLSQEAERNKKAFDDLSRSAQELGDEYNSLKKKRDDIKDLWQEFETLRDKENRTADETKKLIDLQNQLNELSNGTIAGSYDDELNFIIDKNANIQTTLDLLQQELDLKKQIALQTEQEAAVAGEKVAEDNAKKMAELQKIIDAQGKDAEAGRIASAKRMSKQEYEEMARERLATAQRELNELKLAEVQHTKDVLDVYKKLATDEEKENFKRVINSKESLDAINDYEKSILEQRSKRGRGEGTVKEKVQVELEVDDENFTREMEQVRKRISDMEALIKKANLGEVLSTDDIITLREAGIAFTETADGVRVAKEEFDKYVQSQYDAVNSTYDLGDAQQSVVDTMEEGYGVFNQTQTAFNQTYQGLASALWDYSSQTGYAFQTMTGQAINSADGIFAALSSSSASFQSIVSQMAIQTGQTTMQVLNQIASYANQMSSSMLGLAPTPQISFGAPSGGGGGGGKSAEQKEAEEHIKQLQKRKKALDDAYKAFKRYIDAQKEALKLEKEEAEFQDELAQKEKNLGDLKAQIALLALDDSEEAKAKRLQLEDEAAKQEEDITKFKEDRKYDLQQEALDKALRDFKDANDAKQDAIDKEIDKWREVSSAAGGGAGGVGSAYQESGNIATNIINEVIAMLEKEGQKLDNLARERLPKMIDSWMRLGLTTQQATANAYAYANAMNNVQAMVNSNPNLSWMLQQSGVIPGGLFHQGGLVEEHHNGEFAGGLKTNEVFAKLLKGEFVATEAQMETFINKTLPSIMTASPQITKQGDKMGDISVSMPITVQGNLDKKVIPDLEKLTDKVLNKINSDIYSRGVIRNTNINRI